MAVEVIKQKIAHFRNTQNKGPISAVRKLGLRDSIPPFATHILNPLDIQNMYGILYHT